MDKDMVNGVEAIRGEIHENDSNVMMSYYQNLLDSIKVQLGYENTPEMNHLIWSQFLITLSALLSTQTLNLNQSIDNSNDIQDLTMKTASTSLRTDSETSSGENRVASEKKFPVSFVHRRKILLNFVHLIQKEIIITHT
jgi:hypothetical protein